ncbi:MAG: GNAT family N-acetyltransferase [Hyphomicrobiales bacterium]
MSESLIMRSGVPEDVPVLLDIYNHYVRTSPVTFDIEPVSLDARRKWFKQFSYDGPHQLVVAERGGQVLGYAHSTSFRPKPAYARSVETTVYVTPESAGEGIAGKLYEHLLARLDEAGVHRAYAIITLPNDASIALHERAGFKELAVLSEVGDKFGKFWNTLWMERRF